MPKKIFLSHSSEDKSKVRKLAQDIRDAGIFVWLDETEIAVGESISERVQQGLAESDYVGLWITRHALASGWVQREWQMKFNEEASKNRITVLPLLADDIKIDELPPFLRDKRFADFRTDYKHGLSELIKAVRGRPFSSEPERETERTVADYTSDLLEDLANARIAFPLHGWLRIIPTLKNLPRSGKKIRLETYYPHLSIRSVYDHVLSIAHSADCLFFDISHGIAPQERLELARCIVYHDIAEVLLGDIPAYTNLTEANRNKARIFAERRLGELPPGEPKRIATEFIRMFLESRERESLDAAMSILGDRSNHIQRFFYVLDKFDPIIAAWRYLHQFRGHLDPDAADFLKRMKDFFDNPDVKVIARDYKEDEKITALVLLLQDRRQAREYYRNEHSIPGNLFGLRNETISRLIQGTKLTFVPEGKKPSKAKTPNPSVAPDDNRASRARRW